MNPSSTSEVSPDGVMDAPHRSALLTLLFTDVVDSVQLKENHGDRRALRLLEKHDAVLRRLLAVCPEAREAQVAGDSFCLVFPRPSDAVYFALRFQRELRALSEEEGVPLRDRIGIHVGEVLLTDEGPHGRPIGGLQIDTCARLMSLGAGDQILVSRFVFDSTRQAFRGEAADEFGSLAWLNHGLYEFKGVGDPMDVFEIGEVGLARLSPPPNSPKAYRLANADGESVRGWRPAPGVTVPGTSWDLERCLGEGGFGEVWLARHRLLKEPRVFKFCFQLDRVRSLKREITILRILREQVGEHPGIVRLHDVFLDEAPYYLAMDFVAGGSLTDWVAEHGGLEKIPLEQRLEIVIQVGEALGAAHDAGVIHRDVKPGNVLMSGTLPNVHAQLSDFGIGQINRDAAGFSVTQLGFTKTLMDGTSGTGTHQYMAPELLMGKQATVRSDVYSLGVLLFQLVIGDLHRPVTGDWQEEIEDPLLRDDLRRCLASDPARRWSAANQVAASLRALPERRAAMEREQALVAAAERRAYRRGVMRSATVAGVIVLMLAGLAGVAVHQSRKAQHHANAETIERTRAEGALTRTQLQRADDLLRAGEARDGIAYLAHVVRRDPTHRAAASRLLSELCDRSHPVPLTPPMRQPGMVVDVAFRPDGKQLASTGRDGTQIWDAETGAPIGDLIPFGGFRVAWSPDGTRLAVMRFDARIYDVRTRQVLMELDANPADSGGSGRPEIRMDPQWKIAITSAADRSVEAWDLTSGQRIGSPMQHSAEVLSIAFDAPRRRVLTGCADGSVHLWSIAENRRIQTFDATGRIPRVAFHPYGSHVFAGSADGTVTKWDARSGEAVAESLKQEGEISELGFSPDGGLLLVADQDGGCRFYDATTLEQYGKGFDEAYRIWDVKLTPDGMRAFTRTGEGLIRLWNFEARREDTVPIQPDGFPLAATFSPDGRRIATGCSDGHVQIWDIDQHAAEPVLLPHGAPIWQIALQPGADRLAVGGGDGVAQIWDLQSGRPLAAPAVHGGGVQRLRFLRDGKMITAGTDHFIRVWDADGKPVGKPLFLDANTSAIELMPGGTELLLAAQGGAGRLWNLATGEPGPAQFGKTVNGAALSGDGQRVLLADGTRALLYDRTGALLVPSMDHRGEVTQASFSPSERLIATGSKDCSAQIWDAATGARVGPPLQHPNVVHALTWSSDEKLLATSYYGTGVYIWSAADGKQVGAPLVHPQMVSHVAFSPTNPALLLTGSVDGCVRLWDLETRMVIATEWKVQGRVTAMSWDGTGTRVIALAGDADAVHVWQVPQVPEKIESWLVDWAEATGRRRLAEDGSFQNVPFEEVQTKRTALMKAARGDSAGAALQWAFGERPRIALSPGSPIATVDYSRIRASSGSTTARIQARSLVPTDGTVWAEHVLATFRQNPAPSSRRTRLLDFQARHALSLTSATDARAWLAHSLVLDAQGHSGDAKTALERGLQISPSSPALLQRKAERAAGADELEGAVAAFSEALRSAGDDTDQRRAILLGRAAALRSLGRFPEAGADNLLARNLPARRADLSNRQLDLSAFYNSRLDEDRIPSDRENTLVELSPGVHSLAGTAFDVRGLVQLGNDGLLRQYPREVKGIPVGLQCQRLHLLQAAAFVTEQGEAVLAYVIVRYEDGHEERVPQVAGLDLADWWTTDPAPPLVAAWRGSSPFARAKGGTLCLFKATWENPRPDVSIRSLDYVSVGKTAAPFVVAITAE